LTIVADDCSISSPVADIVDNDRCQGRLRATTNAFATIDDRIQGRSDTVCVYCGCGCGGGWERRRKLLIRGDAISIHLNATKLLLKVFFAQLCQVVAMRREDTDAGLSPMMCKWPAESPSQEAECR